MAIVYASWNIKQFGDKTQKPGKAPPAAMGPTDLHAIALVVFSMQADVLGVMEVTTSTGATGVLQLATGLGYMAIATSNDAKAKPDRYALLYNPNTIDFRGFTWPTEDTTGKQIPFANRHPALFGLTSKATNTNFSVLLLHGPEPKEPGNAAANSLKALAKLKVIANPPEPTIISGDFNVDYNKDTSPYADLTTAGYSLLYKGNKTSLKQSFKSKTDPGNYLNAAYDNMYLSPALQPALGGAAVADFVLASANQNGLPAYAAATQPQQAQWQQILTAARSRVSDHLALYASLNI